MTRALASVTSSDLAAAVAGTGLAGRPVVLHSSLSSFGHIDGGAPAVVDAFVDAGCTLIVPTFTAGLEVQPPADGQVDRNGMVYGPPTTVTSATPQYSPAADDLARSEMGAVPAEVLARHDRVRGGHPLNPFAAVGSDAERYVGPPDADDPYRPLRAVVAASGAVVLAGVGYDRMTLLHLAEAAAGRALFVRWALDERRQVRRYQVGGCSAGFHEAFAAELDPLALIVTVGASRWRVLNAAVAFGAATDLFRQRGLGWGRCEQAGCFRCEDNIYLSTH